jgi:acetoacetyl-CoA synthetase
MEPVVWTPSPDRLARSRMTAFETLANERHGVPRGWPALHHWSVTRLDEFWSAIWDFTGIIGDPGARVVEHSDRMPGARFFPDATLNVTENLLRRRGSGPAIIATSEAHRDRTVTWDELRRDVGRGMAALRRAGVQRGDRVAAIAANGPETIVAALAAAGIGAIWSSCSPDFGVQGILDRFGQFAPAVLFTVDGYHYGGKTFECLTKTREVAAALPSVRQIIVVPFLGDGPVTTPGDGPRAPAGDGARDSGDGSRVPETIGWDTWLGAGTVAGEISFERFDFNTPLYILFSSGTTGVPKCIVHSAGGTLVQLLKEHQLHCDIRAGDRVFYFTTCGWMMWNWLVAALASEATIVLYDGSPFHPDGNRLFDLADAARVNLFGCSAKYLDAVRKAGLRPADAHRLETVRTITSTGSPLAPESFDFVHGAIKGDVHLASISGGTDICSCFVGGNPNLPVHRGEIQGAGLGMDVDVFTERGQPAGAEPGELVCRKPFPSMPLGFWNDDNGARYRAAYFDDFPGVWRHGDWIRRTQSGGFVIYGRSDATLNPGGVRIGTAEIYRQVEQLDEVLESLAVGQQWDGDERIVLFVRLAPGVALDDELRRRLATHIRTRTTPRHVPAKILQVHDIPRTKSGKIVELAVRDVVHGRPVRNLEALANPAALDEFRNRPELA